MVAIPEDMKDLLDSTALAQVATEAPSAWPGPGDERVIFELTPGRVVPRRS